MQPNITFSQTLRLLRLLFDSGLFCTKLLNSIRHKILLLSLFLMWNLWSNKIQPFYWSVCLWSIGENRFFLIGVCWIERSIRTLQIWKSFDALWIVTILKWSFYLIRTCSGTLIWDGTNRCQHINNWRDFEIRIYCKHQLTYCK